MTSKRRARLQPQIVGVTADEEPFDEDEVLSDLIADYDKLAALDRRSRTQRIHFDASPVCLAAVADAHIGVKQTDHRRLFEEGTLLVRMPQTWIITAGDMVHNMIIAKLVNTRFNGEIEPIREWAIVKKYLRLIAPNHLASCGGNHDNWFYALTGIPYFKECLKESKPAVLFKSDDITFTVTVGKAEFPVRVRHKWRYSSILNLSHGIERQYEKDGNFLIGIGAHRHTGANARTFNAHCGRTGLAMVCGTYETLDPHAAAGGFPGNNNSTVPCAILYDDGKVVGVSDLKHADEIMRKYYPN